MRVACCRFTVIQVIVSYFIWTLREILVILPERMTGAELEAI
jgi:hypothetical protein